MKLSLINLKNFFEISKNDILRLSPKIDSLNYRIIDVEKISY